METPSTEAMKESIPSRVRTPSRTPSSTLALATAMALLGTATSAPISADPLVRMRTDFGEFFINLTPGAAPNTVENFLGYVNRGDYEDSFFHRNPRASPTARFVLQGGEAFWPAGATSFNLIPDQLPVVNEFNVSNTRGTVAMAKVGGDPNSATNNWFVNLVDNGGGAPQLDTQNGGFTVFGTIDAAGMEVIDAISDLPVATVAGFTDIPIADPGATLFDRNAVVLLSDVEEFAAIGAPAAAILPASRAVALGTTATGFATLINSASTNAASCSMSPETIVNANFAYRQTNPATNVAFGINNPLLDIPAGESVSLVFSMTPSVVLASTNVAFEFTCGNASAAALSIDGVNTFELSASNTPSADVVALAATLGGNGINDIPTSVTSGAFSVATVNLGATETIVASADIGDADLPVEIFVCPTDPVGGDCLEPPAPTASTTMDADGTGTFAVFVQLNSAADTVAFDPANNRAFVRFRSTSGNLRGSTSVALRTVP